MTNDEYSPAAKEILKYKYNTTLAIAKDLEELLN